MDVAVKTVLFSEKTDPGAKAAASTAVAAAIAATGGTLSVGADGQAKPPTNAAVADMTQLSAVVEAAISISVVHPNVACV